MQLQLRKYKDILDRIIGVQKDTTNGKYTLTVQDYSFACTSISSTTYLDRQSCMSELKRYPRKTLKSK